MQIHIPDNPQYRELKEYIAKEKNSKGPLIKVLHKAQDIFGYLPKEVQYFVAKELNVNMSSVYGVVTFYNFFSTKPKGENEINVCLGTACYVRGRIRYFPCWKRNWRYQTGDNKGQCLYSQYGKMFWCLRSCACSYDKRRGLRAC